MKAAATTVFDVQAPALSADKRIFRLAGLAVATLLPALFWVTVAAGIGQAAGVPLSTAALTAGGSAIALFLGAVCAPIMLKA